MAVSLTTLNALVDLFRPANKSPNVAKAFDEVGKLLTKVDAELWDAVGDLSTRVKALEDADEPPPPPPPPGAYTVTQNVVGTGGAVSGTYGWAATPSDIAATAKVEFVVDGTVKATDTSSPYQHSLDTTTLVNGTHAWVVRATATDGRVATDTQQVTVNNTTAPPPDPDPPPSGSLFFNGDFQTGDLSQWPDKSNANLGHSPPGCQVVNVPVGPFPRSMRAAVYAGSSSAAYVQFGDHRQPWTKVGQTVWHRVLVVFPSGNDPRYPGRFRVWPSGGWGQTPLEWHNRTDGASGYQYPGNTPGSYLSANIHISRGGGEGHLGIRSAGGYLRSDGRLETAAPCGDGPLCSRDLPEALLFDTVYELLVRMKISANADGEMELFVGTNGAAPVSRILIKSPTGYVCADGDSGAYLQCGHYRGPGVAYDDINYISGVRVGPTRESLYA